MAQHQVPRREGAAQQDTLRASPMDSNHERLSEERDEALAPPSLALRVRILFDFLCEVVWALFMPKGPEASPCPWAGIEEADQSVGAVS